MKMRLHLIYLLALSVCFGAAKAAENSGASSQIRHSTFRIARATPRDADFAKKVINEAGKIAALENHGNEVSDSASLGFWNGGSDLTVITIEGLYRNEQGISVSTSCWQLTDVKPPDERILERYRIAECHIKAALTKKFRIKLEIKEP